MNTLLQSSRLPDITFHRNGRIDIAARVARILDLKEGDVIDIAPAQQELLLFVRTRSENTVGRHRATLHPTKRGSRNFRTYSRKLTDFILNACNADVARLAAGEPIQTPNLGKTLPIILKLLKHS